jgi:hypothetical protein
MMNREDGILKLVVLFEILNSEPQCNEFVAMNPAPMRDVNRVVCEILSSITGAHRADLADRSLASY